jgi:ankyrin repeat protein
MSVTRPANVSELFKAIADNEYFRVRLLLDSGIDVNSDDGNGMNWTPLHAAAALDRFEIAELLIERQGDIDAVHRRGGPQGAAASVLVRRGANVHACGNRGTALDIAADRGHLHVVSVLLDALPPSPEDSQQYLERPLRLAVSAGHTQVAQLLVEHNAPATGRGVYGLTLLHQAGNADIARMLVDRCSANLDDRDDGGNTALHVAADRGRPDVVKLLVALKANIEARNSDGETPLHVAATQSVGLVVTTLLTLGAERNARTPKGESPLDLARAGGYTEAVAALTNHRSHQQVAPPYVPAASDPDSRPRPWWKLW